MLTHPVQHDPFGDNPLCGHAFRCRVPAMSPSLSQPVHLQLNPLAPNSQAEKTSLLPVDALRFHHLMAGDLSR